MKKAFLQTSKILLVTRPNHDLTTTYISTWALKVLEQANKRKITVFDLSGKKATKNNLESYIKEHQPKILFLNGHGSRDLITGFDNEILISTENIDLLVDKMIYALSCDAGFTLGSQAISTGALAFIGYTSSFVLGYSEEFRTRPLQDNLARLFLEPSNLIPISLLKGNNVLDVHRKSQEAMLRNFYFALSTKASSIEKDAAPYLWHNRKYQVLLGNLTAKL